MKMVNLVGFLYTIMFPCFIQYITYNFASILSSQRFAAVIMRIREPKTTALIFASGKMVSFAKASGTVFNCKYADFYTFKIPSWLDLVVTAGVIHCLSSFSIMKIDEYFLDLYLSDTYKRNLYVIWSFESSFKNNETLISPAKLVREMDSILHPCFTHFFFFA